MAEIETKEVFDLYFKDFPTEKEYKLRSQVDRPEVYEYEKKLGKQIFDMDADELFDMILTFGKRNYRDNIFSVSYSSFSQIASQYRSVWNFYIDNIKVIKNPWNNPSMRGLAAVKRFAETKEPFSYNVIEKTINNLYNSTCDINTVKNIELIISLFYNGFASPQEIVLLKEDMINFKTHEIKLSGRTVKLSDRCFELLEWNHSLNSLLLSGHAFEAVPYNDGYFKFFIKSNSIEKFQSKPISYPCSIITKNITEKIKSENINCRMIYLLGFYDYMAKEIGKEKVNEIITSVRNSEDVQTLMKFAKRYGLQADNVSYIKRCLRPFMSV